MRLIDTQLCERPDNSFNNPSKITKNKDTPHYIYIYIYNHLDFGGGGYCANTDIETCTLALMGVPLHPSSIAVLLKQLTTPVSFSIITMSKGKPRYSDTESYFEVLK